MYLFKRFDGIWIFGSSIKSVCPAGIYRLDSTADFRSVAIHAIHNRDISLNFGKSFGEFLKEDGDPYASMAEFEVGTLGFFSSNMEGLKVVDGNGNPTAKPDIWDSKTSATVVYEGFKLGGSCRISKTDLTAETRLWATGEWANRIALIYE